MPAPSPWRRAFAEADAHRAQALQGVVVKLARPAGPLALGGLDAVAQPRLGERWIGATAIAALAANALSRRSSYS